MRQTLIGMASFLMLVAVPHVGNAGDITYSIQNYLADQDGTTLSGTITTDGMIGDLAESDILSWSYTMTPPTGAPVTASSSFPQAGLELDGSVVASATSITIAVPSAGSYNALNFGSDIGPGSSFVEYYRGTTSGTYYRAGATGLGGWTTNDPAMGGTDPWVIAEVSSVPEPSSLTLAGSSTACGLAFAVARKRRRKRPASPPTIGRALVFSDSR
jgi:PEP-CTERM motif